MASDEIERLKSALLEERRILAAICLGSPMNTVRIESRELEEVDKDTAISKLQNPDGSLTISVAPRA